MPSPRGRFGRLAAALLAGVSIDAASGADFDSAFNQSNDFGGVGLLQTPTARMRDDGEFGIGVSTVRPYNQLHLFLQLTPWLESTVRYTAVTSLKYNLDPQADQSYRDRSADLKIRLLRESGWRPALAFGVQDVGGTGFFGSEYVVASYHWYDFDFSSGLAWGRLGAAGSFRNPFALLNKHFDVDRLPTPGTGSGSAGGSGFGRLFTGREVGVFGGIQWNTPLPGLAVRVEWDGNDYQHEALGNFQIQNTPINAGLAYRPWPGLDLGVGYERGNKLMARVETSLNLEHTVGPAKTSDPPPPPVLPVAQVAAAGVPAAAAATPANWPDEDAERTLVLRMRAALAQQGLVLVAADPQPLTGEYIVWLSQSSYRNPAVTVGRAVRALDTVAPPAVQRYTIVELHGGVEVSRVSVPRAVFDEVLSGKTDFDEATTRIDVKAPGEGYDSARYYNGSRFPALSWDYGPGLRQSIGGPDNFIAAQVYAFLSARLQLSDHLSTTAVGGFNIWNNFDQITVRSDSVLPHVRSDIVQYLKEGANGLTRLEADYIDALAPGLYWRASAGLLEEMYGGVAGELLYKPYGERWAVGIDANWVRQRGFNEQFDFRPYQTATGFLRFHYELPWYHLLAELSVGQYLARDRGATFELSREFANGVRAGAFATKTNVSAAQFGEGSFDKGLYVTIPFDLFFERSTRRQANLLFRPLTRDGGQRVADGPDLYRVVSGAEPGDYARGWLGLVQ